MADARGARERARAEITAEILAAARRQLATDGAAGLSLRAVAREIGMVSSAVYRYVASRDELLTLLIIESYDALGAAVEAAARQPAAGRRPTASSPPGAPCGRGPSSTPTSTPCCTARRCPATPPRPTRSARPRAPTLALVGIVADAHRDGDLRRRRRARRPRAAGLARRPRRRSATATGVDLPDDVLVAMVAAWTQLFGLVSFEVFGQTRNVIHEHAALFDATVLAMAKSIGLRAHGPALTSRPRRSTGRSIRRR